MKKFTTISEAFDWWIKNIYPDLNPDKKKGKTLQAMQDYTYGKGISEKRMRQVLIDHGHFTIETLITYKP